MGCTTGDAKQKRPEKKLDGNYTRMLRAILKQVLAANNPQDTSCTATCPLSRKTIQVIWARHAVHLCTFYGTPHTWPCKKQGRAAQTYIQQLCEDTGCLSLKTYLMMMNDKEEWRERVWDICATSAIWWWWYFSFICIYCPDFFSFFRIYIYIYIYIYKGRDRETDRFLVNCLVIFYSISHFCGVI